LGSGRVKRGPFHSVLRYFGNTFLVAFKNSISVLPTAKDAVKLGGNRFDNRNNVGCDVTSNLSQKLDERAHFVAGRHAWFRDENDPSIQKPLANATLFLKKIQSKLPDPQISGATTASPDDVIVLYWLVKNVGKIVGLYVTFQSDGTSNVRWNDVPNSFREVTGMSVDDLIAFDVPRKFDNLRRHYIKSLPHHGI
jgi:hypothetical protein